MQLKPEPTTELSDRERDVLWLYGGEGLPMKHVAAELGITLETGKSYLKRVRAKLGARPKPIAAESRVDLFMAALGECTEQGACLATRDDLLRYLLGADAPERLAAAA